MNTIFVIFGATGDLSKRKLVPALFEIFKKNTPESVKIIAVGRKEFSTEEFHSYIEENTVTFIDNDNKKFSEFLQTVVYQKVDINQGNEYSELKETIETLKEPSSQIIYYLSIAPQFFPTVTQNFKHSGLNFPESKIIFEKPFGTDLESAHVLNETVRGVFLEEQVYRIDHYVGKEAIQNILAFRFSNILFEPLWNNKYIDNIQITASEKIGVGDRGGYYDTSGALRDMIQNHLFQVLSLITMDVPSGIDAEGIRSEKMKIFRTLSLGDDIQNNIVFGQYQGYKDEPGVPVNSRTETFVALKLEVGNWRFAGVPIYLRTGKSLKEKSTKIVIEFKEIPNILFQKFGNIEKNRIILEIQPNESINISFNIKENGSSQGVKNVHSSFEQETIGKEAYEKLLEDAIVGDKTLFTSWDMLKKSWEIVDNLVNCRDNCPILHPYSQGTDGPTQMHTLLENDNKTWY